MENKITILSDRKHIELDTDRILYIIMVGKNAEFHMLHGEIYHTRSTILQIEEQLNSHFIRIHRGCLVSAMAIHDIRNYVELNNGEKLSYTIRKKKELTALFHKKQKELIGGFLKEDLPVTWPEYCVYYRGMEHMPFAFADIEMVFNEKMQAVDWIFCYGNPALASLEKVPLENLIGNTFSSLFANMDTKWLRLYERAVLYGETIETVNYSPEIDTRLKITCFPTFSGHCGCVLYNADNVIWY